MSNQVSLRDDGLISIKYIGDQTAQTMTDTLERAEKIIKQLRAEKKPVLMLGDASQVGQADAGSRRVSADMLKKLDFDRGTTFGLNLYMTHLGNFILGATGKGHKVKNFRSQAEAEKWLKSG